MNKPNHEKTVDMLNVNVRHEFTEAELKEQANLLSQAVKNKAAVEADKKVAMSGFTNQIKKLDADINIHSSNHNNGFTYQDEACELWLDYDTNTRVYVSKSSGKEVKHEAFYPSDYQKKIDFTGVSAETQDQIDENNQVGEFAEQNDQLDKVISDKVTKFKADKKSGKIKTKPLYDVNDDDLLDGLHLDGNGNLTDLP